MCENKIKFENESSKTIFSLKLKKRSVRLYFKRAEFLF